MLGNRKTTFHRDSLGPSLVPANVLSILALRGDLALSR
jgi:hypothetical protein